MCRSVLQGTAFGCKPQNKSVISEHILSKLEDLNCSLGTRHNKCQKDMNRGHLACCSCFCGSSCSHLRGKHRLSSLPNTCIHS